MSIPAVVLICVIFVDPALFANLVFRQPSGSDEGAGVIMLLCSQKWLRMGPIRSPAALPRTAIRGRAFLSEHPINSRFGLNKDGLSEAKPITLLSIPTMGSACAQPILRDGALATSAPAGPPSPRRSGADAPWCR